MSAWTAMDAWLAWLAFCGVFVNAWLGWNLGRIAVHVAWSAVAAASWVRWSYAVGREHGYRKGMRFPPFVYAPEVFFRRWWMFLGTGAGSISTSGPRGSWRGIGAWSVHPAQQPRQSDGGEQVQREE